MRHIRLTGCLGAMLFLFSCQGQQDSTERPDKITDEPLKQEETDQDTTLQDVEEVTIRAVGGEELESMGYDQDTIEVRPGSLVKLAFINEGKDPKMIYNIVFTKEGFSAQAAQKGTKAGASGNYLPDSSMVLAASPLALPGQTVKMEFTAPLKASIYEFVNTYPSETQLMKGKLIVK